MNRISTKLAVLLLGSGNAGNLGPLVGRRRHDVTFRHIHPDLWTIELIISCRSI
jgi:hypothetical protein